MATPTLYHAPSSFFSQRARLAFEEKKLKYRSVEIAIMAQEQLQPWYARIHPLMTVPGLALDTGTHFIDSESIIGYLDQITPELPPLFLSEKMPEGQKCNHYLRLFKTIPIEFITFGTFMDMQYSQGTKLGMKPAFILKQIHASIEVCQRYSEKYKDLRYEYLNKATALTTRLEVIKDTSTLKDHLDHVEKILTEIDEELGKNAKECQDLQEDQKPWLCGGHFNVADIYLATILHRLSFVGYSNFWSNGNRPQIEQYYHRVLQRDSFRRSCLLANDTFWAVKWPTMKYKLKCLLPKFLGTTAVASAVIVGAYIYFKRH
ncbi:ganglioside-induced differentiation-associated protein 1-like [Asterias rubens]|uniref:ganglioside-induced differentiation-associated protein 1-like n=1 Tax=Asterias rubens TaxID=7604 RepID=UPI00145570C6|nr:ganglioside-induced differentiation-associated protein 1-like [Asterias rubens]